MRFSKRRPFRFEAAWLTHDKFKEFLKNNWLNDFEVPEALWKLQGELKIWNRTVFGKIEQRKRELKRRIDEIQQQLSFNEETCLVETEKKLQAELQETLRQEEIVWYQKSRGMWIDQGDRNTRYYHQKTLVRRRRNKVVMLKDGENRWVSNEEGIRKLIQEFYQSLFYEDVPYRIWHVTNQRWGWIAETDLRRIDRPLQIDEIRRAFFSMGPLKAPGDDGFQAVFYQKNWDVLGESVSKYIMEVWRNPEKVAEINRTLLVMVPKVDSPETVAHFRPIALCNVLYKGITKILVQRMKGVMDKLVSPFQASFVPGRSIHDNIVIAKEAAHMMNRMKGGKGYLAIKIDLEKAYDRMNWNFIVNVLAEIGFPEHIIYLIQCCMSSVDMSILWNGDKGKVFHPTRGVRQGDPISPYLFVLGMEKLSHLIADGIGNKRWQPLRVGRKGIPISHLMFADDLLIFCEANVGQL